MSPERIRSIQDATATDAVARLLRGITRVVEPGYRAAVDRRNRRYDAGLGVHRAAIPVVSVGNLTTGGTGKTPVVAWLAEALYKLGRRPAVLLRGYKTYDGAGDEALLLRDAFAPLVDHENVAIPVVSDADRVRGARTVVERHPQTDLILLDDGFQHRRLHREFDLVLVDATSPFGHGRLLPRGMLREPVDSLTRAHAVLLTKVDLVERSAIDDIRQAIARVTPIAVYESRHAFSQLRRGRAIESVELLRGQRVTAFCAIGNPDAFRTMLERAGATVVEFDAFADHRALSADDLQALDRRAEKLGVDRLITTAKDAVKLPRGIETKVPLWVAELRVEIESAGALLDLIVARASRP